MKRIVALICLPTIALASSSPTIYDSPLYSPVTPPSPQGVIDEHWIGREQVWSSSPTPSISSQSSIPGSPKSPLVWEDVRRRAALVTELSNKLTELEAAHKALKKEFEDSRKAFDGLSASPVAGPLKDKMDSFIEEALQDKTALGKKCTTLACQIANVKAQLERAALELKAKASTHEKQKILGITEDLINAKQSEYERNEKHLAATHAYHNTVLPASFNQAGNTHNPFDPTQAKRGGPEMTEQQQKLAELLTSISAIEEQAWNFSNKLSQQKEVPITDDVLQQLVTIKERIADLKKEAGHLALAAYPDNQEREAGIKQAQTSLQQAATPTTSQDAATRSIATQAVIIHIIITVG